MKRTKKASTVCISCGKKASYLGPMSGKCNKCRNEDLRSLERQCGLKRGELGR